MLPYLLLGLVALVTAYLTTPIVAWLAVKVGAIDQPNDRKVHARPTPTLGGAAIFIALFTACGVAALMPDFAGVFSYSSQLIGILAGAVAIFALGVVDDFKALGAPAKLSGQVFAGGILFLAGVKIQFVPVPGSDQLIVLSDDISFLVTVIWTIAMVNAINLVDGLDGLAAGIVSIAAAAFFVYSFQLAQARGDLMATAQPAPVLAIVLVGATLGFLRFNFHPARIFMGDSGAMLLGFVLGGATVSGVLSSPVALGPSGARVFLAYFPLVIPLAVVAIPILDAGLAIVRRARRRRNVFHADKEHLHHRLMDLGHGHRKAVIVMYMWSALASGAGLAFTFLERDDVVFALPIAVSAIVLYTLFPVLTKAVAARIRP